MWSLYDELIEGIPPEILVEDAYLGTSRSYVEAGGNLGMAMVYGSGTEAIDLIRRPLRDVAALSKSWDFPLASLGVSAINAWYNRMALLEKCRYQPEEDNTSAIINYRELLRGKKVAVVGHFYMIEQQKDVCDMVVLERNPQPGDLPDSACEFVLPEQDYVFITGSALVNKTMPRLLQLSQQAVTILAGPTVTMSPVLFRYGADVLAGTLANDTEKVKEIIKQGNCREQFIRETLRLRIIK